MRVEPHKVLVLGSGGREHAIVWALKKTSVMSIEVYCIPGNAGIAELAHCVQIPLQDHRALIDFARAQSIDLTFVGPEGPLAEGIVDSFQAQGLAIAGPTAAAARLESSKSFAKSFMTRHKIPTAAYRIAESQAEASAILQSGEFGDADSAVVIKADGLAAGKGVIMARSHTQAELAATDLLSGKLVGNEAATRILIEETLAGVEASVLVFADGKDYRIMPAARDHKRVGDNDSGPNTGGMGAITDSSILDESTLQQIAREIVEPTLSGAREEGFAFKGVLFIGLMMTSNGPRVLEYNVRFGDPETQAILVRLQSSLFEILSAIATECLGQVTVEWSSDSSACVVLASAGYPGEYQTGLKISGIGERSNTDVQLFHAGTARSEMGDWVTAGGRVLGVTASGANLSESLRRCYQAVAEISWPGMHHRRDIGKFMTAAGS